MPTFWSQCKAHIIISWGICFFLRSSLCTTGFILHKVACFPSFPPPREWSWPTVGSCAEPIAERPLFLTHFACLSIANNDGTRSSSSLKTHVRARTWRCR